MTLEGWFLFVAVWFAASLPLGPNALNCIAASAATGFRQSLWTVAGILAASLCHITATVFGLAAITAISADLLTLLKICGAAYLIWMGLTLWRNSTGFNRIDAERCLSRRRTMRRAILISLSNPKAVFSYTAIFSQFIEPGRALFDQLAILIPTSFAISVLVYGGYCALGTGIAKFLHTASRRVLFQRITAGSFIAIGCGLFLSDEQSFRPAKS